MSVLVKPGDGDGVGLGAGKTTVVNLIERFMTRFRKVLLDGVDRL
jgi:hypothetical protein